jgi:hypothetical protein
VSGQNLGEIVAALQEMAVDWIKPLPARYASISNLDGVKIEVQLIFGPVLFLV